MNGFTRRPLTTEQAQASIERHARFLTPEQRAELMHTEADRLALDRAAVEQRNNGTYERLRDAIAARLDRSAGA